MNLSLYSSVNSNAKMYCPGVLVTEGALIGLAARAFPESSSLIKMIGACLLQLSALPGYMTLITGSSTYIQVYIINTLMGIIYL